MRLCFFVLSLCALGCFRTLDSGSGGARVAGFDAGPRPDVPFVDAGFPDFGSPDAGSDAGFPAGDAGNPSCGACETNSDCPESPLGCGRSLCVAGACALAAGACEGSAGCDVATLMCVAEPLELTVRVTTDYVPFVEFDRLVILVNGRVVAQDVFLASDPRVGFVLGPLVLGAEEEIVLSASLFRNCDEISSRTVIAGVDSPSTMLSVVVSRDG